MPLRLAYVTSYDSTDVHGWSGLGYHIAQALAAAGCTVDRVTLPGPPLWLRALGLAHRKLLGARLLTDRERVVVRAASARAGEKVARLRPDVVFCPGTIPLALLETDVPMAFWVDAVFPGLLGYYPEWKYVARRSVRQGMDLERVAVRRASLRVFASDWAARTACESFDLDPRAAHVVPFGSNLEAALPADEADAAIARRQSGACRLLFVGVDWERKGGRIALEAARAMRGMGMQAELDVVGCQPPSPVPSWVRVHGFVSKRTPAGRDVLRQLLSRATFFVLPTRAECAGIVFAEASSFALPILATDTGGVPTYVRDGRNGRLLPLDAGPEDFARAMADLLRDPGRYRELALGGHRLYREELNWGAAGRRVEGLLRGIVNRE